MTKDLVFSVVGNSTDLPRLQLGYLTMEFPAFVATPYRVFVR